MKKMILTQMEQTQAQGWAECGLSTAGAIVSFLTLPVTAPLAGLGIWGAYLSLAGASVACGSAMLD